MQVQQRLINKVKREIQQLEDAKKPVDARVAKWLAKQDEYATKLRHKRSELNSLLEQKQYYIFNQK